MFYSTPESDTRLNWYQICVTGKLEIGTRFMESIYGASFWDVCQNETGTSDRIVGTLKCLLLKCKS